MTRRRELVDYYARRAAEYDRIYERPERRQDLAALVETVQGWAAGHRVLELACGTGWWTERVAPVAENVTATDASPEVLEVARQRPYPPGRVELRVADAFEPSAIPGRFTAALAGFWLSHVPRAAIPEFLDALHERLGPGAQVILFDNRFVKGSSTPISRCDAAGDTWQRRRLRDGREYEVLKNFLTGAEIRFLLRGAAAEIELRELTYYWAVSYRVDPARSARARRDSRERARATGSLPAPDDVR